MPISMMLPRKVSRSTMAAYSRTRWRFSSSPRNLRGNRWPHNSLFTLGEDLEQQLGVTPMKLHMP